MLKNSLITLSFFLLLSQFLVAQNAPTANDDSVTTIINSFLTQASPGVLDNDTDVDGDVLIVTSFLINGITYAAGETASITEGTITITEDGSYSFTPNQGYLGAVSLINYTISDGVLTSSANLNISVIPAPEPPVARDDYDTAEINTTLTVPAPGVLVNDTDANEENQLEVTLFLVNGASFNAGQTANFTEGSMTINADGSYVFVPTSAYTGDVPVITYVITDGIFTSAANLFLTVEFIDNHLELTFLGSCNQGFTANGEYKVRYTAVFTNRSTARDYHETSLIRNIEITDNLQAAFGNNCVINVDEANIYNDEFTRDYVNGGGYPREFDNSAINDNFLNVSSNSILNDNAFDNLILYPRQNITLVFCVTVDPDCDNRIFPTPSGNGYDFTNTLSVTSNRGGGSDSVLLTDFHTTEAVVTAGLYIPEFNDALDPPGTINPNGTYDYINTIIITNEGTSTANNVNFNMGLGSFFDNGVTFNDLQLTQVSGSPVTINTNYDGNTESNLLLPNNSLAAGETVIIELFYLIGPINNTNYSYFYQNDKSQTQGAADGFDDTTAGAKRDYTFVTWSDGLGDHLDRYYRASSPTESVSSELQCDCNRASMRFLFNASSRITKTISNIETAPNDILEHEEITFQISLENTSESVQLDNLQLVDDLNNACAGNVLSISPPTISSSTATTNPTLNPSYDGISDTNIFDGTSGLINVGEIITVEIKVLFNETCNGNNSATFTATDPLNRLVTSSNLVNVIATTDTDNDGITNDIDIDDDNDTIPDLVEYNGLDPLADDNSDFIPNYRDTTFGTDSNSDGIVDIFDFDNDGVPNHFDLDSDNDGILDIVEAGNSDADTTSNGRTNNNVGANGLDDTNENSDTRNTTISYILLNTDVNGNPNFLDIDSDDDGIVDNVEAQPTNNYITISSSVSDVGINDAYPNGINPVDTENDGIPDYIDINSDNDIRDDIIEGYDANSDGTPETLPSNSDADNDGLDDAFDNDDNLINPTNGQTPQSFPNFDNTDNPERDWREIIAVVVLINNITVTESEDLIFTLTLVTKNDNTILVESASSIDINFSTTNGTSTTDVYDVATSPFDYTGFINTTYTIAPFDNQVQFTATSLEDNIYELTEYFTLNGSITSNNTFNTIISGIGTILDNDDPPGITMNDSREDEGVDLVHTITLTHPSSTPIITSINSSDSLAISPDDYTSISEDFTIDGTIDPNNANLTVSFNITTLLDNLNELDEENLNVTGVVSTSNVGSQDLIKTGTILDTDPKPLVDIQDVTVEEGYTFVFTIRLLNADLELMQNYLPINLALETVDETTTVSRDYQYVSTLKTIPAHTSSITQSVNTINDRFNEETERLLLLANLDFSSVSNIAPASGIGFIKDNDYPNLFSPNGDNKSDFFNIKGIEDFPNFKLVIFNRQGNEVYNYSNNGRTNPLWWDGTHNGKPAPTGVYFYTLDFNDSETKPITNFIQLIR